jgi:hypothetical protein
MKTLQRIDWYGQVFFSGSMILSIPFLLFYGFGVGLLILGGWQLISAFLNTYSFIQNGFKKEIRNYWIFTIVDLIIFFCPFLLDTIFERDDLEVLTWAGAFFGIPIAIYYLVKYDKLIKQIDLSKELNGFVKQNNF